ncbi:hypothetical protein SAMN05216464_101315 [Mucilaginibacter pineti]|uniref:MOSC domain-containing protein n=1 Tax=Mucilaginibacter pineti TaxID=1391627 RepID=A0A1G6TJ24_9SPHI|nr:MOSC N-terminal beta barrel domain-containing protein [Mucilaginibacter pineti]SDD29088.1 hypothetical protein SAMN05216464_101315 [Mucilaginibacter pineti]
MLRISELFIYPIKSLGGITVNSAEVTSRGLKYDRRWMLVDEHNRFITQREHTQMALLKVLIGIGGLSVTYPSKGSILIPYQYNYQVKHDVVIWDDACTGVYVSNEIDAWFSEVLNIKCRLVYMPDDSEREVDQRYALPGMITSFADGYPFLLIGQASLDDLNSKLHEVVPMDRFRPNIVFTGGNAFEEDQMNHLTISGIDFYGAKLCARCVMTTIDQQTGIKTKEPLKTLAGYRLKSNKIMFGQNLIHKGSGTIAIGDMISVLSRHEEERFIVQQKATSK